VFDKFSKYHTRILLGDFDAKVGREDIFKLTIGNESLHEISNDNGVKLVNFATSKNLRVKSTMFPHTWTSPDGKTHNQIYHFLVDRRRHSNVLEVRSFRSADCDTDHYQRKEAKLQWLQDPSEINGDNLNNVRREAGRYFRNKKEGISERQYH
jgi:hypothetical protein